MKTIAIALASAFAIAPAFAQWDGPYYNRSERNYYSRDAAEYARVINSYPVYATAREECWNPRTGAFEQRHDSRTDVGKGAALGALAGGVLGHQIDHGQGTAAGAILGGIIGHQIEKDRARDDDLDLSHCRMVSGQALEGYDVRYQYEGREYVARLAHEPGRNLRLGTDINWDGTPFA